MHSRPIWCSWDLIIPSSVPVLCSPSAARSLHSALHPNVPLMVPLRTKMIKQEANEMKEVDIPFLLGR